jgi:hypothetical protein
VGLATLGRWAKEGRLECTRVGSSWYTTIAAVRRFILAGSNDPSGSAQATETVAQKDRRTKRARVDARRVLYPPPKNKQTAAAH